MSYIKPLQEVESTACERKELLWKDLELRDQGGMESEWQIIAF